MIRSILWVILLIAVTTNIALAGKPRTVKTIFDSSYPYEIHPIEVGIEGTKYVKVWGVGKSVELAIESAKRQAVAAAIFGGIPGREPEILATPALCNASNAYQDHSSYFDSLFYDDNTYLKFVESTSNAAPSGLDRLKVKGGYKVGIKVQIYHSALRQQLEKDNIIRSLNYGF